MITEQHNEVMAVHGYINYMVVSSCYSQKDQAAEEVLASHGRGFWQLDNISVHGVPSMSKE